MFVTLHMQGLRHYVIKEVQSGYILIHYLDMSMHNVYRLLSPVFLLRFSTLTAVARDEQISIYASTN